MCVFLFIRLTVDNYCLYLSIWKKFRFGIITLRRHGLRFVDRVGVIKKVSGG